MTRLSLTDKAVVKGEILYRCGAGIVFTELYIIDLFIAQTAIT